MGMTERKRRQRSILPPFLLPPPVACVMHVLQLMYVPLMNQCSIIVTYHTYQWREETQPYSMKCT